VSVGPDKFEVQEQMAIDAATYVLGKASESIRLTLRCYAEYPDTLLLSSETHSQRTSNEEMSYRQSVVRLHTAVSDPSIEMEFDWENLQPDTLLLNDFLMEDSEADEDCIPSHVQVDSMDAECTEQQTAAPHSETSTNPPDSVEIDFAWVPPAATNHDSLNDFRADLLCEEPSDNDVCRVRERDQAQYNHHRLTFSPSDIACLTDPHGWLNDLCINQCASLLYRHCQSPAKLHCALFSSFAVNLARQDNSTEDQIWRHVSHVEFWLRHVWIIPIHFQNHWLLCVADIQQQELLCFDSFGDAAPWETSVLEVCSRYQALSICCSLSCTGCYPINWICYRCCSE